MFAMPVAKESETFAGRFARRPDADVIEIGQAKAMHHETATADIAADFATDVILRLAFIGNREDTHAAIVGRANQTNQPRRSFRHWRVSFPLAA